MLQKRIKSAVVTSIVLAMIACTNNVPNNTNIMNGQENFSDLDKEYVFTSKALTLDYFKRKIRKWLDETNGPKLVRELTYAKYKHGNLYCDMIAENSAIKEEIEAVTAVQDRETFDIPFKNFIDGCGSSGSIGTADEFKVNSTTSNDQELPAVAVDAEGDYVVVWQSRNNTGFYYVYGIYGQRYYSDGSRNGSEFVVNEELEYGALNPDVAMDADGDFVVVWQDTNYSTQDVRDYYDIFARRYSKNGVASAPEQIDTINNIARPNQNGFSNQSNPTVAMDANGDYVIAWQMLSSSQDPYWYDVFARRYNSLGQTSDTSEFRVASSFSGQQYLPAAAMDSTGNFIIAFTSRGNGYGIYAQRYNTSGEDGSVIEVTAPASDRQGDPSVAMDDNGDFVVAWSMYGYVNDSATYKIEGKRYSSTGNPVEFTVNSNFSERQYDPSVVMNNSGTFVVTWTKQGQGDSSDVFAKGYDSNGQAQGNEFQVNRSAENNQQDPAAAIDDNGDFIIAWTGFAQDEEYTKAVFAGRYNALDGSSTLPGSDPGQPAKIPVEQFRVNSITTGDQNVPDVAMDAQGRFIVVWRDDTQDPDGSNGVYAQKFNSDGTPSGNEFRIATYYTGYQDEPSVAINSDGSFVITWFGDGQEDNDNFGIFAKKFASWDATDGIEFPVNTFTTGGQEESKVAVDANGNFVITWESRNQEIVASNSIGVYARRFDSNANPLDPVEFPVNSTTEGAQRFPSIAMEQNGDFVIAWSDMFCANSGPSCEDENIKARRFYFSDGSPKADEFLVNTYTDNEQGDPAISIDQNGDFIIAWVSYGQDGYNDGVFAQRYNSNAETQVPTGCSTGAFMHCNTNTGEFQVNTGSNQSEQFPSLAIAADGSFVVDWERARSGRSPAVFAQRYNPDGSPRGKEFNVSRVNESGEYPAIAGDSSGDFAVTLHGNINQYFDDYGGIIGKRYNANGDVLLPPNQ
jgi:hypothetical protein